VPAPISSASAKTGGSVPIALRIFVQTCWKPIGPKSMPHLAS
jgi:hypothetical protein